MVIHITDCFCEHPRQHHSQESERLHFAMAHWYLHWYVVHNSLGAANASLYT